jgi:glycosyltransferase involved in cell wall biosynthesis
MEKLSAALIIRNQEEHLRECLSSLTWADEIVVLDGFSTDNTVPICREFTDKIYQRTFTSFNEERQALLEKTSQPWVLMIDGDMVVPKKLIEEIQKLTPDSTCAGYTMRALTTFLGREIRHCGWFEPTFLRLFNKEKGGYDVRLKYIDHFIVREGTVGILRNHLLHYGYKDIKEYLDKINRYTSLDAEDRDAKGLAISPVMTAVRPVFIFVYKYIWQRGFLDGIPGLIICLFSGFTYLVSYYKLWELRRNP